jgi:hypothetical protein
MKIGDTCLVDVDGTEVRGTICDIRDEWFDVRCPDGYVVRYPIC